MDIETLQNVMATEANKTHANITMSFTLQDGALFEIKYKLPKKITV